MHFIIFILIKMDENNTRKKQNLINNEKMFFNVDK